MNRAGSIGGMILTGELNVAEEKPMPVPLRLLQKIRKLKFTNVIEKKEYWDRGFETYSEILVQCFHITSAAMSIAIWARRTKFVSFGVITRSEVGSGVTHTVFVFLLWRDSPQWAMASPVTRFIDHTQRRTTVGRTPLDD